MANRIKGITVEIGGDVTGLDKALNTVNKTIKSTQSQLKDVERLLKLDPSNTELLSQKQKILKESISATKEKLDALKTAQEQAKKQLQEGTLGQDKYDALQREIIETEQQLKKLEDQAKKSNVALTKISEAGKSVKEFGDNVTKIGTSLSKDVTAPIVAIGAASMAAFTEVDSAIDGMISKTGGAGVYLEKLETAVDNVATSIPTDFQTAADAVGEVSIRFRDVGDNLEDLSGYFVKFAAVNNTDVVSAVDNVQSAMAAFGVETKDAGLVLDMLTQAAQWTGSDVNQLTSAMVQNAGAMKEMGFSIQDSAFFLGDLSKNGIDASSVMTGLKKAWQTASKDGKSMDDVIAELDSTIMNASSDTEAYQAAIEVFGAKAGPAIAQAMREGRLELDVWTEDLDAFTGDVERSFNATLDPIDQTTLMMNELKLTGADLASIAQEMLLPVMEKLREKLKQLREWWTNLDDSQKENIIRIAAIVAAVGPLLVIFGKVISTIGTIMSAASALGSVISFLASPIGVFIAAVAAAIAIGVLLYKNWDTIKEKAGELKDKIVDKWNGIKEATSEKFQAVKDKVSDIFDSIKRKITEKIEGARDAVKNAVDKIKGFFSNLKLELPKIKLPHFSISGKFSLDPPSIPKISVDWYRKAMANGMILNSPTIFGMKDGNLLGAGEAGSETVVGTNSLMRMIGQAVNNAGKNVSLTNNIYIDGYGSDLNELAEKVGEIVGTKTVQKLRISGI